MNPKKIAQTIKRLREEKGYTQTQLAELVGVKWITVAQWEQARRIPDDKYKMILSQALEITIQKLFFE
jgi:transcriptional regulator with XRE-family HTH domain